MNLYFVTCDNNEPWPEDHSDYSTTVRASSKQEAETAALRERESGPGWSAEAEVIVENIDILERKADLFDKALEALKAIVNRSHDEGCCSRSGKRGCDCSAEMNDQMELIAELEDVK